MKYKPSAFAKHMLALDGYCYSIRQGFLDEHGRPGKNNPAGQAKFDEYMMSYMKDIDEKFNQLELKV